MTDGRTDRHTHTDGTNSITSTADAGLKNIMDYIMLLKFIFRVAGQLATNPALMQTPWYTHRVGAE